MTILLIDNYDSFTYNLFQMTQAQTSEPVVVHRNDALSFDAILAERPSRILLSPGPGHPDTPSDFGVCSAILSRWQELSVPVLGVCLGHQGMGSHWGGRVTRAPVIMHGKTSLVDSLDPDCPLLKGLPQPFEVMRYHSLVVEEASIPEAFRVTAKDRDHGLVMAMRHREWPLFGVQFHPESIGTPQGALILANFLQV
jgi:anthranilate synthase component II